MKKIGYAVHRLVLEYKGMHKPGGKELLKLSVKVSGTAVVAAVVLKFVDMGFGALLSFVM